MLLCIYKFEKCTFNTKGYIVTQYLGFFLYLPRLTIAFNKISVENNDYEAIENGKAVLFGSGPEWCYSIRIMNDQVLEGNETLMVILSSTDPDVRILNNISVVSILDDGDSK